MIQARRMTRAYLPWLPHGTSRHHFWVIRVCSVGLFHVSILKHAKGLQVVVNLCFGGRVERSSCSTSAKREMTLLPSLLPHGRDGRSGGPLLREHHFQQ